jgi:hypothetical protein
VEASVMNPQSKLVWIQKDKNGPKKRKRKKLWFEELGVFSGAMELLLIITHSR